MRGTCAHSCMFQVSHGFYPAASTRSRFVASIIARLAAAAVSCIIYLFIYFLQENMQAEVATWHVNQSAIVLSLTNIFFRGPENTHILKRERCRDSGIVSISSTSQSQDYMALLSLRVCCCPCIGFNFNPLSTSAMWLLPTAIYCRQIERFQGASGVALLRARWAGCLHLYSVSSHTDRAPSHLGSSELELL